jgi:hypothetical protein
MTRFIKFHKYILIVKLKLSLLSLILDNPNIGNKYSKCFLNLKNVFELEQNEEFEFSEKFIKSFEELEKKFNSFHNGIPLSIIEKYYIAKVNELDEYVYIEYNEKELTLRIIDLYVLLEQYFSEIFSLACEIADYYNLEVKINSGTQKDKEFL